MTYYVSSETLNPTHSLTPFSCKNGIRGLCAKNTVILWHYFLCVEACSLFLIILASVVILAFNNPQYLLCHCWLQEQDVRKQVPLQQFIKVDYRGLIALSGLTTKNWSANKFVCLYI